MDLCYSGDNVFVEFDKVKAKEIFNSVSKISKNHTKIIEKLGDIDFLDTIENILRSPGGQEKKQVLLKFFDGVKEKVSIFGSEYFFGVSEGKKLEHNGTIYHPMVFHSWGVNFAWLLAHLKKGNEFRVVSEIVGKRKRSTQGSEHESSAFAREICAALKAKYELKCENGIIVLQPSIHYKSEDCVSNGQIGDGINPSHQEVDVIFDVLEKALLSKKDLVL